jgi:putative transposase
MWGMKGVPLFGQRKREDENGKTRIRIMLIYEYKLDGTKQQYAALDEATRIVQFIRNKCLRLWMDTQGTSKNDLQCYCAVLAKDYPFAARLNSQARQASASRAWFAIERFYDNCKNHKPGKKGNPKQHIEAFPRSQIRRVHIVKRADGFYLQFGVQAERQMVHQPLGKQVGIDLGLLSFLTDSVGNTVANPHHLRKAEKKLKRLHHRLSRKQKQSQNRKKARKHLAKSISDAAWGRFLAWVKYYGVLHGVPVLAVEPAFTSQQCNDCGGMVKKSLSVRTHVYPKCGLVLDRDHNVALNILQKALEGTLGHRGTSGSPENAWGEAAATALSERASQQVASRNQESPAL